MAATDASDWTRWGIQHIYIHQLSTADELRIGNCLLVDAAIASASFGPWAHLLHTSVIVVRALTSAAGA